jgi:hypothetical protein
MSRARDVTLALRAKKYGARYSLRIIWEARAAGIPISLAFALVEQESNFRNVYGHDPVRNPAPKGGAVTKRNYLAYKADRQRGLGMQGVGVTQLTWFGYQDEADRLGGCWTVKAQLRVAFQRLAEMRKTYGTWNALRRYNGAGPRAHRYADEVLRKAQVWHKRLS